MEAIEGVEVAKLVSWSQSAHCSRQIKRDYHLNRSGPTYLRARELTDPPYLGPAQNRTLR